MLKLIGGAIAWRARNRIQSQRQSSKRTGTSSEIGEVPVTVRLQAWLGVRLDDLAIMSAYRLH